MADTVGSAEFLVKIRDMVTGPMKSIAASVGSALKSVGSYAAGNLLATGITRAVDAVKGFVAQGLAANAQFDQLNISFAQVLGSQRKAAALMGDIQKMAANTPFEMPGLADAASKLLGTREIGENEVIPMLKKIGDAAAGSTDGFASLPRIARAISQMFQAGKINAEEMNQLADAGVPAWGALAKKMGLSQAAVKKLGKDGKLGMKEIRLLVDGLGEQSAGLAQKMSKTFEGLKSTISDNLGMGLAKVTRPIYDAMTKVMAGIVKIMDSAAWTAALDKITAGVQYVIELFGKIAASPLTKVVVQVAAIAAGLIAAGVAIAWVPALVGMAASLAPLVATIAAIGAAAAAFGVLLRNAFTGEHGEKLRKKLAEVWFLVKEIAANIRDALMPVLARVGAAISGAFGQSGALQTGFNGFLTTVVDGMRTILDVVSVMTANFSKTWEFLKVGAAASLFYILDILRHIFLEQAPNLAMAFADGMFETIDQIVQSLWVLVPAMGTMIMELITAFGRFIGKMGVGVAAIAGKLGDIMGLVLDNFQSLFSSMVEYVVSMAGAMFSDVQSRLGNAIAAAKALISGDSRKAAELAGLALSGDGEFEKKKDDAFNKLVKDNEGLGVAVDKKMAAMGDIFQEKILGGANQFGEDIGKAGGKFGGLVGDRLAFGAERVADAFNKVREKAPEFKTSAMTDWLSGKANQIWQSMRNERGANRNKRLIEGLGLKEIPGQIGKGLADLILGGNAGLMGGVDDFMEIFHKKPGDAAADEKKEKKNLVSEFVGYSDMNKRIQGMLGKEDKDKKAHLKAAQAGAVAAQQGAENGGKVVELAKGIKGGIEKVIGGLGFGK